jgi:hypothetical protein
MAQNNVVGTTGRTPSVTVGRLNPVLALAGLLCFVAADLVGAATAGVCRAPTRAVAGAGADPLVARPTRIGQVGNSGDTSEPHLHIQVQNGPTFGPAAQQGLRTYPMLLSDVELVHGEQASRPLEADPRRDDRTSAGPAADQPKPPTLRRHPQPVPPPVFQTATAPASDRDRNQRSAVPSGPAVNESVVAQVGRQLPGGVLPEGVIPSVRSVSIRSAPSRWILRPASAHLVGVLSKLPAGSRCGR